MPDASGVACAACACQAAPNGWRQIGNSSSCGVPRPGGCRPPDPAYPPGGTGPSQTPPTGASSARRRRQCGGGRPCVKAGESGGEAGTF
eukprot:13597923-Alexandrium_andersonii.AAC.1